MKKTIITILTLFLSLNTTCKVTALPEQSNDDVYITTMKQDLLCLMLAYPNFAAGVVSESPDRVYLVMKSGKKILYDDKKAKTFEQRLANPDLQDILEQPYPLETTCRLMDKNFDPGRFRVYSLLSEVYGSSKQAVERNLANVSLGYRSFQFNKSNNAAGSLKLVMNELIPLASKDRSIAGALFPSSGTFNYRRISGTGQLSPHSFGIAIDLARDPRDYWQWASKDEGQKRLKFYPKKVVEVFEKNNFVWGGKWSHFDTLHFEYRPEIILKAKYFGSKQYSGSTWYEGAPYKEPYTKDCIDKINQIVN